MVFAKYKNKGYYFDSYGRHPAIYSDIAKVLKENFHQIIWNNIKLQGITTTACGDYCVLFALLSARKWSFTRIIQRFHSIPYSEWRDHAVRRLIIRLYGHKALASIRKNRKGLTGIDKLHINKALRVVRLKNSITNIYNINRIID